MYTNDTYKRITYKWDRPIEKPADYDILLEYADRLKNLEDLIEEHRIKFLPCRLGQTVFFVHRYRVKKPIEAYIVDQFVIGNQRTSLQVHNCEPPYETGTIFADCFGKEIFTNLESAKEALEASKKR